MFGGWPYLLASAGDALAQVLIASVTGAVAVEFVFGLPGLGTTLFDAIQLGDTPVVLGVVGVATIITYAALIVRMVCAAALPKHLRSAASVPMFES
jgi:peptide/nickel transport system permease protein